MAESGWKLTGEALPDGRPIWKCDACGRRIWGHSVAPHGCNGQPAAVEPCAHRGLVYTTIQVGCCRKPVYTCGLNDIRYCSITQPGMKVGDVDVAVCVNCPFKKPTLGST